MKVRLIIPPSLAFLLRVERKLESRGGELKHWDLRPLEALRQAHDPLGVRAACAQAGFKLVSRQVVLRGVPHVCLAHRSAA